jgi:hypothetical protein
MSKPGAAGCTKLLVTVPDRVETDLLHSFSVDLENEESVFKFLHSLLELYGERGEGAAAKILRAQAWARAICGALVQQGKLVGVGDGVYRLAE